MRVNDTRGPIDDAGLALVRRIAQNMGFNWRETDIGCIDAAIDVPAASTDAAPSAIGVRSHARNRLFLAENDRRFHYLCDTADIERWMSLSIPVIVVCSHPQRRRAWWTHAQDWFSNPEHHASGRMDFVKKTQRFDHTARPQLTDLRSRFGPDGT